MNPQHVLVLQKDVLISLSYVGLHSNHNALCLKFCVKACPNGKCLATKEKHHQTLFGDQTFHRLATLFGDV